MSQHEHSLKGEKIAIIIDDNPRTRNYISAILSNQGIESFEAVNGIEGYKSLCNDKKNAVLPDVILMDIYMPSMDGLEATKMIKECKLCQSIPIILFSSDHTKLDRINKETLGVDEVLHSPFKANELLEKISKVISKYKNCK